MKTAVTAVPSVVSRPPGAQAPELPFPARATLPTLRKLREKHFRGGSHDLALQVAMEVARRDPGRESFFRLGFLYREVGRYREALRSLRDALPMAPFATASLTGSGDLFQTTTRIPLLFSILAAMLPPILPSPMKPSSMRVCRGASA